MSKAPKLAYQILLGIFMLTFTVVACNNKKDKETKETTIDTVKPVPPIDTTGMGDTLKDRPVAPGD